MTVTQENPAAAGPVLPIVRVAVLAERRIVEMALPTEVPLREILPAVVRLVHADADAEAEAAEPGAGGRRLSLAPIGGAPYSLDASLDTVGVVDGDLLALTPTPTGPAAPGVVEDVADAAVIFSAARLRGWGLADIRRLAHTAVVITLLAATGLAVAHRLAVGGLLGLYALGGLAAVAVVAALWWRGRADELSVAALVPVGAVFTLAVPGSFGAPQVMLGAAGVTAWALLNIFLGTYARSVFTAVTAVGVAVAVVAGIAELWPALPLATLGAALMLAALLLIVQAAPLSALWARLPLPVIPAPGDPVPPAPAAGVLADLPRRVRLADAHQSGFVVAAVVLSVLGSVAVVAPGAGVSPWAWYLIGATAAASMLRARVWDSANCKRALLAQPVLLGLSLIVMFAVNGNFAGAGWTLLGLAVLTLGVVIVAANPGLAEPDAYSIPMRRVVGLCSAGLDASLIPVMAYLVGIFAWVLNR